MSDNKFNFEYTSSDLSFLDNSREIKDKFIQYNLDQCLSIHKFRFFGEHINTSSSFEQETGQINRNADDDDDDEKVESKIEEDEQHDFSSSSTSSSSAPSSSNIIGSEYEAILKEFFSHPSVLNTLNLDSASSSISYNSTSSCIPLSVTATTLDFFNPLFDSNIIGINGSIKGCFDNNFDGLYVGDLLREMLVNEESENADLFSANKKKELIYQIFSMVCIGGSLCQPDINIESYLELTKRIYKEVISVYKDSRTGELKLSGRSFLIVDPSLQTSDSPYSKLIVVIDSLKRKISVIKKEFKSFW